ncbi:MAG: DUF5686 and carboxypeptidase regulatory-like domain-containing protein [Bacteroidia bacterium]|nr:DUF5686 and carboxypeptidase regulatory-like domain-containing protein [Bacteroidia bacterium]
MPLPIRTLTRFLLLTLLALCGLRTAAQSLSGTVTDPDGQPLPYVKVYIHGAQAGALSRESGTYALKLPAGQQVVVFQCLGYETFQDTLLIRGAERLDVVLAPSDVQMEAIEISVGKEDPAYAIMEQAIAAKKQYLRELPAWQRSSYIRIRIEQDTLVRIKDTLAGRSPDSLRRDSITPRRPILLLESQNLTYFEAPASYRSRVLAYQDRSVSRTASIKGAGEDDRAYETITQDPLLFYPDPGETRISLYQNLITVLRLGDRPFVSPFHSELWRLTYRYRLAERRYEEGRVVYVIDILPRNRESASFEGRIELVDGIWAIRSADLTLMPGALGWFDRFAFQHRYAQTASGEWVLAEETYTYELKEGRVRSYGHTFAQHSDYRFGAETRDLNRNELTRVERDAFEKDSAWWAQIRPVALGSAEQDFVRVQDSLKTQYTSPDHLRTLDSSYNHLSLLDIFLQGIGFRDRVRQMDYYFYPLISQVRPYGVGGYRHALGGTIEKTFRRGTALQVSGELDYGFVNRDLKGELELGFVYAPRRFARAFIKGGDVYGMVTANESLSAILSRSNFINKVFIRGGHSFELLNGLYLDTEFEFADRKAIDELELEEWTEELFGENNTPRSFDPYREARFEIRLRYTPGQRFRMEPYRKILLGSKWPTFTLKYKKAVPGIFGSEINFDFLSLKVEHEFRPGTFGIARWSLLAGTFIQDNNLRFNDYTFFRGSDPFIFVNPLANYQLLGRTLSTPNEFVAGHYLHDFGRVLFSRLPLIRRTALQASAGAGLLMIRDNQFLHSEVFAGLQYPFRFKRQRFKVGAYYVTAYSNYENALTGQFKFGITFFNTIKNRWEY